MRVFNLDTFRSRCPDWNSSRTAKINIGLLGESNGQTRDVLPGCPGVARVAPPGRDAGATASRSLFAVRRRLGWLGERIPGGISIHGSERVCADGCLITPHDSSAWARQVPEHAMPNLVVSQMTNSIRAGKVLFGWSSTRPPRSRSPYSLRGGGISHGSRTPQLGRARRPAPRAVVLPAGPGATGRRPGADARLAPTHRRSTTGRRPC